MKVKVEIDNSLQESEITICCKEEDEDIKKILSFIESMRITIIGKKNGEDYVLDLNKIYYFETVENRTFAYIEKDVFEVNYRLYEIVEMLENTTFIQVSRTIVVNIERIEKITTLVNGRILAVLDNGEKMIITRVYAQNFRRKLKG